MPGFKLYRKHPNAISFGRLYTDRVVVPFDEKKRTVRVWVPNGYNPNDSETRYPVLYMCDGQNIVDKYTTKYGEWNLDEVAERLIKKGVRPFLIVGLDCPEDERARSLEMALPGKFKRFVGLGEGESVSGDAFVDYVFKTLKPRIDKEFHTDPSRECTGFGGSSMGGLISFYGAVKHRDIVGFNLCFSPAFCIYYDDDVKEKTSRWAPEPEGYGKFYFYSGGKGFERRFAHPTERMYRHLKKNGFGPDRVAFVYDSNAIHHEDDWNVYSEKALRFWLDDLS